MFAGDVGTGYSGMHAFHVTTNGFSQRVIIADGGFSVDEGSLTAEAFARLLRLWASRV